MLAGFGDQIAAAQDVIARKLEEFSKLTAYSVVIGEVHCVNLIACCQDQLNVQGDVLERHINPRQNIPRSRQLLRALERI